MNQFSRATMTPKDGDRFNSGFQSSVAKLCAGRFGFDPEPSKAFATIQGLIPLFQSQYWINEQIAGKEDCLGKILNHLSLSLDGQTRYEFVVGSHQHPRICEAYVHAVARVKDAAAQMAGN